MMVIESKLDVEIVLLRCSRSSVDLEGRLLTTVPVVRTCQPVTADGDIEFPVGYFYLLKSESKCRIFINVNAEDSGLTSDTGHQCPRRIYEKVTGSEHSPTSTVNRLPAGVRGGAFSDSLLGRAHFTPTTSDINDLRMKHPRPAAESQTNRRGSKEIIGNFFSTRRYPPRPWVRGPRKRRASRGARAPASGGHDRRREWASWARPLAGSRLGDARRP